MFWRSTVEEVEEVFKWDEAEQKARTVRAGLIAATIINVNRKPNSAPVSPYDFLPDTEEDYMSVDEAKQYLGRWAASQSASATQGANPTK